MASLAEALGISCWTLILAVHADWLRCRRVGRARCDAARREPLHLDRIVAPSRTRCASDGDRRLDQRGNPPDRDRRRAGIDIDLKHLNEISDRPRSSSTEADRAALQEICSPPAHRRGIARIEAAVASGLPDRRRGNPGRASRGGRADDRQVDREVIRPLAEPLQPVGGLVALFGRSRPRRYLLGAPPPTRLFEKEGRAVVHLAGGSVGD